MEKPKWMDSLIREAFEQVNYDHQILHISDMNYGASIVPCYGLEIYGEVWNYKLVCNIFVNENKTEAKASYTVVRIEESGSHFRQVASGEKQIIWHNTI